MSAYMIVNVDVRDESAYEEYRRRVPAVIQKHGGQFVVRGGNFEILEGDWKPGKFVVIRFPDMVAAKAFYEDPEYQQLIEIRQRVSRMDMVVVEGI